MLWTLVDHSVDRSLDLSLVGSSCVHNRHHEGHIELLLIGIGRVLLNREILVKNDWLRGIWDTLRKSEAGLDCRDGLV